MESSSEQQIAAEEKLRHSTTVSRDDDVRDAAHAGLTIAQIHKVSGLAMTTIMRILNKPDKRRARQTRPA